MGTSIVSAIGEGLVGMVTSSTEALGAGIKGLLVGEGGALSDAGTVIFSIVGIGFGVGIFYVMANLLRLN